MLGLWGVGVAARRHVLFAADKAAWNLCKTHNRWSVGSPPTFFNQSSPVG